MRDKPLLKQIVMPGLILALGIFLAGNLLHVRTQVQAQEPEIDPAAALGTAFSFQGSLTDGDSPADGAYDFQFFLFTEPAGGSQVGPIQTFEDEPVDKGAFTVSLDFGDVFDNDELYLEVGVRPGVESGSFTVLLPRQALLPVQLALYSQSASALRGFPLSSQVPATDQVLKWDGVEWKPGSNNDTTYSAGTGLDLEGGDTFSLTLSFQLPQSCTTNQIIKCWPG